MGSGSLKPMDDNLSSIRPGDSTPDRIVSQPVLQSECAVSPGLNLEEVKQEVETIETFEFEQEQNQVKVMSVPEDDLEGQGTYDGPATTKIERLPSATLKQTDDVLSEVEQFVGDEVQVDKVAEPKVDKNQDALEQEAEQLINLENEPLSIEDFVAQQQEIASDQAFSNNLP